jgi:hypothetical protein
MKGILKDRRKDTENMQCERALTEKIVVCIAK